MSYYLRNLWYVVWVPITIGAGWIGVTQQSPIHLLLLTIVSTISMLTFDAPHAAYTKRNIKQGKMLGVVALLYVCMLTFNYLVYTIAMHLSVI